MLSCLLVFLIFLLFTVDNTEHMMLTRMIKISTSKSAQNIEEVTVVDNNTNEEQSLEEKKEEETSTVTNMSKKNLSNLNIAKAVRSEKVYDGLTMAQLASKLDRSLKNELSGKEYLVKTCNNVGGMKGSGCGSYGAFPTLDDGIRAFIDNIARNYVAYGLTTADTMNPKYAENPLWSTNVNRYITKIKNS